MLQILGIIGINILCVGCLFMFVGCLLLLKKYEGDGNMLQILGAIVVSALCIGCLFMFAVTVAEIFR